MRSQAPALALSSLPVTSLSFSFLIFNMSSQGLMNWPYHSTVTEVHPVCRVSIEDASASLDRIICLSVEKALLWHCSGFNGHQRQRMV